MKRKFWIVLALGVVILSMLACSFGKTTPTATSRPPVDTLSKPPAQPPANALEVHSISAFTDSAGGFHVVGELLNNSDVPLTSVELFVEIHDANGASLLRDENGSVAPNLTFYPMLYTIGAGETSPFLYYFDATTGGTPATYNVTVSTFTAADTKRGDLKVENVQMVDDGSGYYYLSGELVNLSNQWVHIYGLAGGVLDDSNTVLSADWTTTYTTLLPPAGNSGDRDRTPFVVSIPVPSGNVTQWKTWWDAEIATDVTDYDVRVEVTNSYFDAYRSVHLVGFVTNHADQPLHSMVVAGLYAEDGTCLDANYAFLPIALQPGKSVPFDVSYFGNVNYNDGQAALVSTYTVQIDPWNTYPPFQPSVDLTGSGETVQKDSGTWTVSGNFTNSSTKNVNGVMAVVMVYDAQNNLVAVGFNYSNPSGDFYAPGSGDTYNVYIFLDPTADTSKYTIQTVIVGDYSE